MEQEKVELLNAVALTEAMPERGLRRGQVGTVVEELAPNIRRAAQIARLAVHCIQTLGV